MALDRGCQQRDDRDEREAFYLKQVAGIERTTAIRRWRRRCRATLLRDLIWPQEEMLRERQIENCISVLESIARQLYQRGWLLREDALGELVKSCIAPIAVAQKAGKVRELYPYFKASVSRYVGVNSEEIQRMAKRSGADVAASMADLVPALNGLLSRPSRSLTEHIVEKPN